MATKKKVVEEVEEVVEEPVVETVESPNLYVESHPILGVTRKVSVTSYSVGDGRVGDGATIVRE